MYYIGDRRSSGPLFARRAQPNHPNHQSQLLGRGRSRGYWTLAVITVVCLGVALGAGLAAGLAAQHKPSSYGYSSSGALIIITKANIVPVTISGAISGVSNAPVTVTKLGNVATITPTPTQLPSPKFPAGDSSTYTATNRPFPTRDPYWNWHIPNASLSCKILCYTYFVAQNSCITDLQIYNNVSTLEDCLDRCALFNCNARPRNFPALRCTGVALGTGDVLRSSGGVAGGPWHTCWLKSNFSRESPNDTVNFPRYEGAVLLDI